MKYKIIPLAIIIIFSCKVAHSQWYNQTFQIGSFADPRVSRDNNKAKDSISFTLAKAAHFNLLSGPQFYNGGAGFELMDRTLDLAAKYGMHLMVIDSKLAVANDNFTSDDAQKIISHFKNVEAKKRSAIGGYSFGGEYPIGKAAQVKKWNRYFKDNDPDKVGFVYLLPSYGFKSHADYERYLDNYLNDNDTKSAPQIVAYDYYPFLSPAITASYFYNLDIVKRKAGDRPVWYYIQSTTKKTGPDITDYQLKFMAFCPLAYGSKGAIYYTYESIPDHYGLNYYDAIINPYGNVTKKYYSVKAINNYITKIAGPIIMANSYVGAYHVSASPTNENIPASHILNGQNPYVKSISDKNILVGIYKKGNSDGYYLMLINKSPNNITDLQITVPGNKSVYVFPGSDNYVGLTNKTRVSNDSAARKNSTAFSLPLLHGAEIQVIEIE